MSLYLQRLLDRAAALPPPPVGANPLLVSGSPILSFDQRLASAEMADDFSILGATPDLPEATEEGPSSAGPLARQSTPGAAPPPFLAAAEPRADPPFPALPTRPAAPGTPDAAPSELAKAAETPDAAPMLPRRSADNGAVEAPRQSGRPHFEPNPPKALPAPVQADSDLPALPSRAPADPSQALPKAVPEPRVSEAKLSDPEVRTEAGPAPTRPAPPEARPLPSVTPIVREALRPVPEPTPAEPKPAAEPIVAGIPPLAPPTRGLSAEEVERMIEEAIKAERDRSAAREPANVRARQAEAPGPQGEAPAKRPATAAQASLIGSLESSRFRPMLFGVRRR
jgi:hypothetical protein